MDEFVVPEDIKRRFLERRHEEIVAITASFDGDPHWESLYKLGHQIKGGAETFGFPEFAHYGKKLEEASQAKNRELSLQVLEIFHREIMQNISRLG